MRIYVCACVLVRVCLHDVVSVWQSLCTCVCTHERKSTYAIFVVAMVSANYDVQAVIVTLSRDTLCV